MRDLKRSRRQGLGLVLTLLLGAGAVLAQPAPSEPPAPDPAPLVENTVPPVDFADDWSDEGWAEIEQWAEETSDLDPAAPTPAAEEGPAAPGSEFSSLELQRQGDDGKQRRIRVVRKGTDDVSGIFTICGPREGDDPNGPSVAVFSEAGAGGVEITIDKNVIKVPLALVTQRQQADGSAGDGNIEAGGGTAQFMEEVPTDAASQLDRCGVAVKRDEVPGAVQVTQGQTQLTGQTLKYDESDGIARIAGPITFKRDVEGEKSDLSGTAGSIEVEVDAERTVLVGDVVLNSSGGRVSRAARVEYDDTANLARLIGTPEQPAVTTRGQERLQAAEILYDLERDEAVAWASEGVRISGEFSDEP